MKTTVLEGVRVLDLSTGPVGGFATAVLADFGADVVKVEPPERRPLPRARHQPTLAARQAKRRHRSLHR